jgi:hypothetical protein
MLHLIRWKEFVEGSMTITGVYYLGVIVYYRKGIIASLKGWRDSFIFRRKTPGNTAAADDNQDTALLHFLLTEQVVLELKKVISKVATDKVELPDVLSSIGTVLRQYAELKHTPYGKALNKFIIRECKSNNTVLLDERQLERLWNG